MVNRGANLPVTWVGDVCLPVRMEWEVRRHEDREDPQHWREDQRITGISVDKTVSEENTGRLHGPWAVTSWSDRGKWILRTQYLLGVALAAAAECPADFRHSLGFASDEHRCPVCAANDTGERLPPGVALERSRHGQIAAQL